MCTFTIKQTSGIPMRAQSWIVVLRNHNHCQWSKADCFSPVVLMPMIRLLTSLAVRNKNTLKQGDCKSAFIQATLPEDEITVIKPPIGCPFSSSQNY